ncbi:hypothetical protein [Microbacterium sp. NPDC058389]|uniref:hypothetical protein n=1 Tax=Microbacterium sp. NPDC058389 TaxID=3346475 RepID=UPI0036652555
METTTGTLSDCQPPTHAGQIGLLLLEPAESLTPDQRESLRYYRAADDVLLGLKTNTAPHRWAAMAMRIGWIARQLGRLPVLTDPGVTEVELEWIEVQRHAELNSFQQARLRDIVGWHDEAPR